MSPPIHTSSLSHDPAGRIAARFEAAFEARVRRDGLETYPALHAAWEEALEYHRTIELRPFEVPQSGRVRDMICRLFSLLPETSRACQLAARMAASFSYPASSRTPGGTRAFSHLALLCHAAVREPGHAELRFGEVNPKTYAAEVRRNQSSFHHVELSRLLNFLARWPPETTAARPPPDGKSTPRR